MFTGLVQDIGFVKTLVRRPKDLQIEIGTQLDLSLTSVGASICCSGICLTVVEKSESSFVVEVSQETIARSLVGAWEGMTKINLELSLKTGDELGGHFVFGHIDGISEVLDIKQDGNSRRIELSIPAVALHLVAEKGSVAIDGVSLTVNTLSNNSFEVNIIPHTLENTTLGLLKIGDKVNFEADMLARYVARVVKVVV